ncbi:hypothetical protein EDF57_101884 [Novosphingobium sp. PhB55]|uniref:hypothetical protein n=1 Tax=Novosphingobium sp. PhB55 TaxID=2485106 RepID=UPI0010652DE4|nr:hypothetical protein [Novosphingobium sp. PhB55]TDW68990.1 hypothetical protein EDF57_101884 [Novosphingobium sp. PhB55]
MIITLIWWGFGLAILLMFIWAAFDEAVFGAFREQAIDWIIPHLIPTMSLTGAVAYTSSSDPQKETSPQARFAFLLACLISVVYLLVLAAVIILALTGSVGESSRGAVDALAEWNKLLGVFQGLAASAIGVFFVKN